MNTSILTIGAGVLGLGTGAGLGVLFTKKHFERKYQEIADEEIQSVKEHYLAVTNKGDLIVNNFAAALDSPPEGISAEALLRLKEIMESGEYLSKSEDPEDEGVKAPTLSIFDEDVPEDLIVLNELLANRDTDNPYVITYEEFMTENQNYEKITIHYYEADGALAEEDGTIISDIVGTIGQALSHFGVGSSDPNSVYVRIEDAEVDYEVVKLGEAYGKVFHGVDTDTDVAVLTNRQRRAARSEDE